MVRIFLSLKLQKMVREVQLEKMKDFLDKKIKCYKENSFL